MASHTLVVIDDVFAFVVGWGEFVPFDVACRTVQVADDQAVRLRFHGGAEALAELSANVRGIPGGPVASCPYGVESIVAETARQSS